jgi:hypothetical protein
MATNFASSAIEVEELTEAEAWDVFDAEARRLMNLTGAEFQKLWQDGTFDGSHDPGVTRVAMLMPSAW